MTIRENHTKAALPTSLGQRNSCSPPTRQPGTRVSPQGLPLCPHLSTLGPLLCQGPRCLAQLPTPPQEAWVAAATSSQGW